MNIADTADLVHETICNKCNLQTEEVPNANVLEVCFAKAKYCSCKSIHMAH